MKRKKLYTCATCQKKFVWKRKLRAHVNYYCLKMGKECPVCGKPCKNLWTHMKSHSLERPHSCSKCDKSFKSRTHLTIHTLIHTGEKPHSCSICDQKFRHKSVLKDHMTSHTGKKLQSCSICGRKFSKTSSLKIHERTHTNEKPYSCLKCGKRFRQLGGLRRHNNTHTQNKRFSCSECGREFHRSDVFKCHQITHANRKTYPCSECDLKFLSLNGLDRHKTTHVKNRYSCSVCGKQFGRSGYLKVHVMTHSGEKPLSCSVCPKRFRQLHHLMSHKLTHSEGKTRSCANCGRWFKRKSTIIQHLQLYCGKGLQCHLCNHVFHNKIDFRQHKKIHSENCSAKLESAKKKSGVLTDKVLVVELERIDLKKFIKTEVEENPTEMMGKVDLEKSAVNCNPDKVKIEVTEPNDESFTYIDENDEISIDLEIEFETYPKIEIEG